MIDFNFVNGESTYDERLQLREKFLESLREFRTEFEQKATSVTIDLGAPQNSSRWAHFVFGDDVAALADFNKRFQNAYPPKA